MISLSHFPMQASRTLKQKDSHCITASTVRNSLHKQCREATVLLYKAKLSAIVVCENRVAGGEAGKYDNKMMHLVHDDDDDDDAPRSLPSHNTGCCQWQLTCRAHLFLMSACSNQSKRADQLVKARVSKFGEPVN
jgi:hypothetical protein